VIFAGNATDIMTRPTIHHYFSIMHIPLLAIFAHSQKPDNFRIQYTSLTWQTWRDNDVREDGCDVRAAEAGCT